MSRVDHTTRERDGHLNSLQLSMFADSETPREEQAEIEEHLDACPICSAKLESLRAMSATLATLLRTAPSADVFERTMEAAHHIQETPGAVARERMGRARRDGFRLREVRVPDSEAPTITPLRSRRSHWRAPLTSALPAIAALLLIALTAGLLMRSALNTSMQLVSSTPTATIPSGLTLSATQRIVKSYATQLAFAPVAPTYLPDGAILASSGLTTLTGGAIALDLTWTVSDGAVRTLRLREQPASASTGPANGYASNQSLKVGLAWQVGQFPVWRPMAYVKSAGWGGVAQTRDGVTLLLEAQPAQGASPDAVATQLRLTSLSLNSPYVAPPFAIQSPPGVAALRFIATVTSANGSVWTWDVTLSADTQERNATITDPSTHTSVTEVTSYAGAGVLLDNTLHLYQIVKGPTTYSAPPPGVTQIAFDASSFLATGQLWNLGLKTQKIPDGRSLQVYDLYRVDTAHPEHVYVDARTGAVVAIAVDLESQYSPGGENAAQPYASTTVCPPYTVTYTWLIYESASLPANEFDTHPPKNSKLGPVTLPFTCPS